jgi:hypothetical protein
MSMWLRKWKWWLWGIFAIALIVGWEEERCQAQANQCRANYTEQAQAERPPSGISIDQQASEQQAIAAACEPNGYFCRFFSATNLPSVLLVFIGVGGIYAAIKTLRAIERQAVIMEGQLTVPYRAYLGIIEPEKPLRHMGDPIENAKFPIVNNGHVSARITAVDVEVIMQNLGGQELFRRSKTEKVKAKDGEVPPEKASSYAVTVSWPSNIPNAESIVVSLSITYKSGFKELPEDTFSVVRVWHPTRMDWSLGFWGIEIDLTNKEGT